MQQRLLGPLQDPRALMHVAGGNNGKHTFYGECTASLPSIVAHFAHPKQQSLMSEQCATIPHGIWPHMGPNKAPRGKMDLKNGFAV